MDPKLLTPELFTGANVFVNEIGLLGTLKDFKPPKLERNTKEIRGAIGSFEMCMPSLKPLTCELSLTNLNPWALAAASNLTTTILKIKSNLTAVNIVQNEKQLTYLLAVNNKSLQLPDVELDKEMEYTFEFVVKSFTLSIEKVPYIVYDFENKIYAVNGIDQLALVRANIV